MGVTDEEELRRIYEDVTQNEFPAFIQMLERVFDFKRWGFRLSYFGTLPKSPPCVFYESESCRVRFMWTLADRQQRQPLVLIEYGRLHAPLDDEVMVWNEKKCYCWHEIERPLEFLDGMSVEEAFSRRFKLPPVMHEFHQVDKAKGGTQPEAMARRHAAMWEYYGQRLFDLFDLRYPQLWQQYTQFFADYMSREPSYPDYSGSPPKDKIC